MRFAPLLIAVAMPQLFVLLVWALSELLR